MAAKKVNNITVEQLAAYDKIVNSIEGIERKGDTMPYTLLNGHMFSFMAQDGSVSLRLPAESRETFIKKYKTKLAEAHGAVLKEYVVVPGKLLNDVPRITEYFRESREYISGLKPKATAKKQK